MVVYHGGYCVIYHSENIDKLSDELIGKFHIPTGIFDNVADCRYNIPTYWDIGKVYKRLILAVSHLQNQTITDALTEVYNSWISDKIDDYNSSMYYENPDYLFTSFQEGKPI